MADNREMPFLEHLEVLRWHIIRSLAAVLVFAVVAFVQTDFFFAGLVLGPSRVDFFTYRLLCEISSAVCIDKLNFTLMNRALTGQFMMHMTYSFVVGFILAFPYVFWEFWRFIQPALHDDETRAAKGATFFVSLLFAVGVAFGYFVVSPLAINFLANYQLDPSIDNQIDLASYVSTLVILVLACGLMFQLPVVVYVLSRAGLLTPTVMRAYRRHAIVGILVLAAVITPSPDMVSQFLVAVPVYVLYEISVFISAAVWKSSQKNHIKP